MYKAKCVACGKYVVDNHFRTPGKRYYRKWKEYAKEFGIKITPNSKFCTKHFNEFGDLDLEATHKRTQTTIPTTSRAKRYEERERRKKVLEKQQQLENELKSVKFELQKLQQKCDEYQACIQLKESELQEKEQTIQHLRQRIHELEQENQRTMDIDDSIMLSSSNVIEASRTIVAEYTHKEKESSICILH